MVTPPNPLPPDGSIGPVMVIVSSILIVPTIVTTILRLWVRHGNGLLGRDDYTIAISTALTTILVSLNIVGVKHGKGRHRWYLSAEQMREINMFSWYNQIVLFSAICMIKISICFLLLRIRDTKKLRWSIYAIIAGLIATNLECIIVLIAECQPVSAFWNPSAGTCWNPAIRIYSIYVQASYSVLTDLIVSLLPILVVYNLKLPMRQKVAICCLMALGLVATSLAALRASSLGARDSDITYSYCKTGIYATTEANLGIIAANMALSRSILGYFVQGPLSQRARPIKFQGYGSSNSRSHPQYPKIPVGVGSTICRRASSVHSDASEVPLDPVIKKTTEVFIVESNSMLSAKDFLEAEEAQSDWRNPGRADLR